MLWILIGFGWLVVLPVGLWVSVVRAHDRIRIQEGEVRRLRERMRILGNRDHRSGSPTSAPEAPSATRGARERLDRLKAARRTVRDGPDAGSERKPSIPDAESPVPVPFSPSSPALSHPPDLTGPIGSGEEETDWERILGERWMAWIGIVVLVLGIAFFLSYTLARVGPVGRVAVGTGTGMLLLLAGVRMEPGKETGLLGRLAIGGGWALLYFTAYAAHSLEAARVIADPLIGSLVLAAVSVGLILHSLRYRSQVVTGVAYTLGLLTVTVARVDLFTQVASVILAGGLLVLLHRLQWIGLALCGAVATYANLGFWMIRQGGLGPEGMDPELFRPVWILILVYWVTFAAADLLHRPSSEDGRRRGLGMNLVNTGAACLLMAWLYRACGVSIPVWGTMAAAFVYGAKMSWERRRKEFLLGRADGTAAFLLGGVALHLGLPGNWLPVGWGLLAHLSILVGLRFRDAYFRAIGAAALVMVTLFAWGREFVVHAPETWREAASGPGLFGLGLLCALFYVNALLWGRAQARGEIDEEEGFAAGVFAWAGSILLGFLVWQRLDPGVVPIVWAALGLGLVRGGIRWGIGLLECQGLTFLFVAAAHLLFVNVDATGMLGPISHRTLSVLPVLAALLEGRRLLLRAHPDARSGDLPAAALLSYAVALVVPFYLHFEIDPVLVAPAWGIAGLAFLAAGTFEPDAHLRVQALGLGAAAGIRAMVWNASIESTLLGMNAAIPTVAGVAVVLLLSQSWTKRILPRFLPEGTSPGETDRIAREVYGYGVAAVVAVLLLGQVTGRWLTLAWGMEGLLLTAGGVLLRERPTRMGGLLLLLLCVGKLFLFDLAHVETIYRIASFIGVGGILVGISFFYARYRERFERHFLT